jgi:hypothetical protein
MEKDHCDRDLVSVGIANFNDVGHRCTEIALVLRVVVGGVMASRLSVGGAAHPDTERLDATFQIVDLGRIELKVHRGDERCRVKNPQLVRCEEAQLFSLKCLVGVPMSSATMYASGGPVAAVLGTGG